MDTLKPTFNLIFVFCFLYHITYKYIKYVCILHTILYACKCMHTFSIYCTSIYIRTLL